MLTRRSSDDISNGEQGPISRAEITIVSPSLQFTDSTYTSFAPD
jgi:hypothetical protein